MKSHNGVPLTRIASIHETVRNDQEPMTEKKMTAKAMIFSTAYGSGDSSGTKPLIRSPAKYGRTRPTK